MKKVILGILIGVILSGIGVGVYYYFFMDKEDKKVDNQAKKEVTEETKDESQEYNKYVTSQFNGTLVTEFPEGKTETDPDVVLKRADIPKLLIESEAAQALNGKMYNLYEPIIKMIKTNDVEGQMLYSDVNIDYDFSVKDNIVFIKINYYNNSSRGGSNIEYHGFYYDLESDKELTSEEIANKYNITVDKINSSLSQAGYDKTVSSLSNTMFPSNSQIKVVLVGNIDTPTMEVIIK